MGQEPNKNSRNEKIENLVRLNVSAEASYVPREDMTYAGHVEFVVHGLRFDYKLRLGVTLPKLAEIWEKEPNRFWDLLHFEVTNGNGRVVEVDDLTKKVLWMTAGLLVVQIGYSSERIAKESYYNVSRSHLGIIAHAIGATIGQGLEASLELRRYQISPTGKAELDLFLRRYNK